MKLSVATSTIMHSVLIGWAALSLSNPAPFVQLEEQGVQIDFATQSDDESGKGEKEAEVEAKPVPKPTERPKDIEDAKDVGEAKDDSKSREGVVADKALDTVKTAPAPEAEKVVSVPDVKPVPVETPDTVETPVATTEVANLNEPKDPIVEDPVKENATLAPNPEDLAETKNVIAVPVRAPVDRPKPTSAKTRERKVVETPKRKKTATSTEKRKNVDDPIGKLLNTQENTAGGGKRSKKVASLSDANAKNAPKLTKREYGALKDRVTECWSIPGFIDTEGLKVVLLMRMSKAGYVDRIVDIAVTGLSNSSQVKAIKSGLKRRLDRRNCDFTDVLPTQKYTIWKDVRVNFDPNDF